MARPPVRRPYPTLYQVNTRVWLEALGRRLERPATLDDVPDSVLEGWSARGFDWIWLLGVWQLGDAGRAISREREDLRAEYERALADLAEDDIAGSTFAIAAYTAAEDLGGDEALARFRGRLRRRGMSLMLDFVANHTALDHPWVQQHPDFFVSGTPEDREREPLNWTELTTPAGPRVLAFGRDPYFPGWSDTLQLDYSDPAVVEAMTAELLAVAERCDGVRCDMAMLLLPEIFTRTWGREGRSFWPGAAEAVRARRADFLLMAEVYWDLEYRLQELGFDYTYDKRLYDRLRDGRAAAIREHLHADSEYQEHLARFLENHDEPRAAAIFPPGMHEAAAVVTYFSPGLRFLHQGQLKGHVKRIPVQLRRGPAEEDDVQLTVFYQRLLTCLRHPAAQQGTWHQLTCTEAWDGNTTWDSFICSSWMQAGFGLLLTVVNYAPCQGQCYLQLPYPHLAGAQLRLLDLMGAAEYVRTADEVLHRGLYLDLPAWGHHVFTVEPV